MNVGGSREAERLLPAPTPARDRKTEKQLRLEARRALAMPIHGRKRRAVLILIAVYLDAGKAPSITELAARTRLRRLEVIPIVDRLERDGFLAVKRTPHQRNRYTLLDGRRPGW